MTAESVLVFLKDLPPAIWALAGVIVGGFVSLFIESIKSARRRRAISEIVFMRLHSLLVDINNLFLGNGHLFPFNLDLTSGDGPFVVYNSLFANSTLPAYKLARTLADDLFHRESHVSGISWILSKLEVAEATRQHCVSAINNKSKFHVAWYQYCLALRDFSMGCTPHLMNLHRLSMTPYRRVIGFKQTKRIYSELESFEKAIDKSFGDFHNILSKNRLKRQKHQ